MTQAVNHSQPSKYRRFLVPALSGATGMIVSVFLIAMVAELVMPTPAKPSSILGGFLGRLEAAEVEAKTPEVVALEAQLAQVQRDAEIAKIEAEAEAQEQMQIAVETTKAEVMAEAQIEIENIKAANQRANDRLAMANRNQEAMANIIMQQANETSGVKTFMANTSDLICGGLWLTGTPDEFGVCGAGDDLRQVMAEDVRDSLAVFSMPPEAYLGTIADPAQLALSKELQEEHGQINTVGATDGQAAEGITETVPQQVFVSKYGPDDFEPFDPSAPYGSEDPWNKAKRQEYEFTQYANENPENIPLMITARRNLEKAERRRAE